jgi:hypothetical protein
MRPIPSKFTECAFNGLFQTEHPDASPTRMTNEAGGAIVWRRMG